MEAEVVVSVAKINGHQISAEPGAKVDPEKSKWREGGRRAKRTTSHCRMVLRNSGGGLRQS